MSITGRPPPGGLLRPAIGCRRAPTARAAHACDAAGLDVTFRRRVLVKSIGGDVRFGIEEGLPFRVEEGATEPERTKSDLTARVNGDLALEFRAIPLTSYAGLELFWRCLQQIAFSM